MGTANIDLDIITTVYFHIILSYIPQSILPGSYEIPFYSESSNSKESHLKDKLGPSLYLV